MTYIYTRKQMASPLDVCRYFSSTCPLAVHHDVSFASSLKCLFMFFYVDQFCFAPAMFAACQKGGKRLTFDIS